MTAITREVKRKKTAEPEPDGTLVDVVKETVIDRTILGTVAERLPERQRLGWRGKRLPERDIDGFEFWEWTYYEGADPKPKDTIIYGYKEITDADNG